MDDIEKIIEKYKKELLEFSKQNAAVYSNSSLQPEMQKEFAERKAVSTAAMPAESAKNGNTLNSDNPGSQSAAVPQDATLETTLPTVDTIEKFDTYEDFLKNNKQKGTLRIQVAAANQSFPISNARVTVSLELKNGTREMFEGLTDSSGIIDNIVLPAPELNLSQDPDSGGVMPFAVYTTTIEHPDFVNAKFINVPVFPGIESIQAVNLVPLVRTGQEPAPNTVYETEPFYRVRGGMSNGGTYSS